MIKQIISSISLVALTIFSANFSANAADTLPPIQEMKLTIDKIVDAVEANPGDAKQVERKDALRTIINPKFNFAKMAELSLGANWNNISDAQKTDFVKTFSDLLSKTYLTKIETVKRGMVTVEAESIDPKGNKATVKTLVQSKGDTFPIDYTMSNETGSWKVYDVSIENIRLVVNYRNEFAAVLRKEGFDGLMERLRNKV